MKKQAFIISFIAIFLTITANIGDLRCQEKSNMIAGMYQSGYMKRITDKINEDNVENDKNIGVEVLGLIIQHHLFYEYQKIDTKELEDRVERSR